MKVDPAKAAAYLVEHGKVEDTWFTTDGRACAVGAFMKVYPQVNVYHELDEVDKWKKRGRLIQALDGVAPRSRNSAWGEQEGILSFSDNNTLEVVVEFLESLVPFDI